MPVWALLFLMVGTLKKYKIISRCAVVPVTTDFPCPSFKYSLGNEYLKLEPYTSKYSYV